MTYQCEFMNYHILKVNSDKRDIPLIYKVSKEIFMFKLESYG